MQLSSAYSGYAGHLYFLALHIRIYQLFFMEQDQTFFIFVAELRKKNLEKNIRHFGFPTAIKSSGCEKCALKRHPDQPNY